MTNTYLITIQMYIQIKLCVFIFVYESYFQLMLFLGLFLIMRPLTINILKIIIMGFTYIILSIYIVDCLYNMEMSNNTPCTPCT